MNRFRSLKDYHFDVAAMIKHHVKWMTASQIANEIRTMSSIPDLNGLYINDLHAELKRRQTSRKIVFTQSSCAIILPGKDISDVDEIKIRELIDRHPLSRMMVNIDHIDFQRSPEGCHVRLGVHPMYDYDDPSVRRSNPYPNTFLFPIETNIAPLMETLIDAFEKEPILSVLDPQHPECIAFRNLGFTRIEIEE